MNKMIIDTTHRMGRINRDVYGHFSEHLGRCIYEGLWVGPDSAIPNIRGFRKDVLEALQKIKVPTLRWPGGCFADEYHWMDGIGPKEKRKRMINTNWGGVIETNEFGTHEFLDLCELLECDAYICGNVGSGTVREMSEWVEYMTFAGESPMANLRRANGRDKPWKVPYFGVGNENWGGGGNMRPEFYADLYRQYQTFVRKYDGNSIYKIAGGAPGDDKNWTEVLMANAAKYMDGLSLHYYTMPGDWTYKGLAVDFPVSEWALVMKRSLYMETLINEHGTVMDKYDPAKRVGLILDEWGTWYEVEKGTNPGFLYQQNTIRDALVAGIHLNIFNNHCDRVRMANIAQVANVLQAPILTRGAEMILTPTYHVFDMYAVHQDAELIESRIECDGYGKEKEAALADEIPCINGSVSEKDGFLNISLCNLDHAEAHEIECEFFGLVAGKANASASTVIGRVLTGDAIDSRNTFEKPLTIVPKSFSDFKWTDGKLTVNLPARSVVTLIIKN